MKKGVLFVLGILLLTVGAGYIFYAMPILADSMESTKEGITLWSTLDAFFDTELVDIWNGLKEFDPKYLFRVSGYLLVCGMGVSLFLSMVTVALMNKTRIFKYIDIFIAILMIVIVGFGIFALVKFANGYHDFDGKEQLVTYWGYIYYVLGLFTAFLLIFLNKLRSRD